MTKTAIFITAILLAIAMVATCIILLANGTVNDWVNDIKASADKDSSSGSTNKPSSNNSGTSTNKPSNGTSSGLNLPSSLGLPKKSPIQKYVSTTSSSFETISGITSSAAALVKMSGNELIAGVNADVRIHPASMSKVMTLIVACENIQSTDALLTVEQWMIDYSITEGGSGVTWEAGQQVSVEDALFLISYRSDTVSCLMIAEYVAGSEKAFVAMMNQKAKAIGLSDTHFANTTGLYEETANGNGVVANDYTYTTCRDMAAIMYCAMKNEAVKSIITSYTGRLINYYENGKFDTESSAFYTRWYSHKDRLADNPYIDGTGNKMKIIAGKTGGEDIPSSCFVTVATDSRTGEQYICVTVGRINQDDGSYVKEATSTEDTKKIYKNYAYN